MKKIVLFISIFIFSVYNVGAYCSDNSYYIENQLTSKKRELSNLEAISAWNNISSSAIDNLRSQISSLESQLQSAKNSYQACLDNEQKQTNLNNIFNKGYNSYKSGNYSDAISYFSQYLQLNNNTSDADYNSAKNNLILSYKALGDSYIVKNDYDNAMLNFLEIIKLDYRNSVALGQIGVCYYFKKDYDNATKYFNDGLKYSTDIKIIEWLKGWINDVTEMKQIKYQIEEKQELIKNAPANDSLSYLQYYIKQLNIHSAWNKVKNNNQVVVAVIDDGININHPDLVNSIWVNKNAKYGDSKIIDFVGDGMPANLPVGEHGTMIAGIIGATQNNNEGIAGISKNVKLMPLRVFDKDGNAKEENIIKAINYAIDNGANIINLSLGQSQFYYSNKYDEVIKKAYEKGVVVVIASGNGDILSGQNTGINLTNNPISPVCNNESKYKYSIGVYAINEEGYRTNWTNYGNCANFWAPGVGIVSTSIPVYNSNYGDNYNMSDGTSFSAPIISGIIALGYNQYGYINPVDIYDSLEESKIKDDKVGYKIDASKYIDILGKKVEDQKIKQKAEIAFNSIKKQLNKKSTNQKVNYYNNLLKQLNPIKNKLSGDKSIIINHLIYLLNQELGK